MEELNGEGFPYSPYVLRRPGLMAPAAMAVMADSVDGPAAAPEAPAPPAPPPVAPRAPSRDTVAIDEPDLPAAAEDGGIGGLFAHGGGRDSRSSRPAPHRRVRCSRRAGTPSRTRRPSHRRARRGVRPRRCTSRRPRSTGRRDRAAGIPGTAGCCSWGCSRPSSSCSAWARG